MNDAGVVDPDIYLTQALDHPVDDGGGLYRVADIKCFRGCRETLLDQLFAGSCGQFGIRIGDDDAGACLGKPASNLQAELPCAAGNHHHLALKLGRVHGGFPSVGQPAPRGLAHATSPPSTSRSCPVMKLARSEAKKATALAIS